MQVNPLLTSNRSFMCRRVHHQHHLTLELEVLVGHVVERDPAQLRRRVGVVVAQLDEVGVLDDAPEALRCPRWRDGTTRGLASQHVEHLVGTEDAGGVGEVHALEVMVVMAGGTSAGGRKLEHVLVLGQDEHDRR